MVISVVKSTGWTEHMLYWNRKGWNSDGIQIPFYYVILFVNIIVSTHLQNYCKALYVILALCAFGRKMGDIHVTQD